MNAARQVSGRKWRSGLAYSGGRGEMLRAMTYRIILRSVLVVSLLGTFVASCTPVSREKPLARSGGKAILPQAESTPPPVPDQVAPVVEFWDNGNFMSSKPPTLLFVVWSNGTMMRQVSGRLYLGIVTAGEVNQLLERLSAAGADRSPISTGIVYPDGVSQLLWFNLNGQQYALKHDGGVSWQDVDQYQPPPPISRVQIEAFVEMWSQVLAALDDVWPVHLDQINGVPALPYPGVR